MLSGGSKGLFASPSVCFYPLRDFEKSRVLYKQPKLSQNASFKKWANITKDPKGASSLFFVAFFESRKQGKLGGVGKYLNWFSRTSLFSPSPSNGESKNHGEEANNVVWTCEVSRHAPQSVQMASTAPRASAQKREKSGPSGRALLGAQRADAIVSCSHRAWANVRPALRLGDEGAPRPHNTTMGKTFSQMWFRCVADLPPPLQTGGHLSATIQFP